MKKVVIVLDYSSVEPPGISDREYRLEKEFEFPEVPQIKYCTILLKDDARDSISMEHLAYSPSQDKYYIHCEIHDKVRRYFHGNAKEIMEKEIERYKKYGWKCTLISEGK